MRVQDIAFFTNEYVSADVLQALPPNQLPPNDPMHLANDLWIGKLDEEFAKLIFDACGPPGYGHNRPTQQYTQLYAFVREPVPDPNDLNWDTDQYLQQCITLSRLVRPITSYHYSARIIYEPDDLTIKEILPAEAYPFAFAIYPGLTLQEPIETGGPSAGYRFVKRVNPKWLTADDLESLHRLISPLFSSEFRDIAPLWRAFCYYELAARSSLIDVKWLFVYTAFEALVDYNHFDTRVPQLARELGCPFNVAEAKTATKYRGSIAHGKGYPKPESKILGGVYKNIQAADLDYMAQIEGGLSLGLYNQMEEVLRHTIMWAIQEPEFAKIFKTSKEIKGYFKKLPRV